MRKANAANKAKNPTVVLAEPLPDWALEQIRDDFRLTPFDPDCIICREAEVVVASGPSPLGADLMDYLPALKYICCVGSGYEGIDMKTARERKIVVSNSAIATAEDVADHTLALFLALHSRVIAFDKAVREGCWEKTVRRSLRQLNAGIVGLGAIGLAVARRLEPLGCQIRWTGPRSKPSGYRYVPDLYELADWADILIVAARADQSNRNMIGAEVLARLGSTGALVNVSRGSILDEDALIDALVSQRLGGAALDVFQSEPTPPQRWENVPNTILTPHIGGFASGVQTGIQDLIGRNIRAFFSGQPIEGAV